MHIIHLLTRLLRAGSEENTIATCLWQADHGHEVTLIHGPDPDPHWHTLYGKRIRFIEVPDLVHPIRLRTDYRAVQALRALYRELRPDVIHTHQSKAGIIGRLAAPAVPEALVVHGIHIIPFDGVSRATRAFYIGAEKMAARYTDQFIAVSRSVGQAYVDAGICSSVEPIYSGMPLEPYRDAPLPADWPALLGVPEGTEPRPPVALMLAAYEPRKRHVEFLRAFAALRDRVPELRILFAGKGPYEPAVRACVAELGLEDRVIFCGFRSDPHALIALSDLCLLTSEREGLPRVVVQYITSGKPVVVADLPGIDEIVIDGETGLVTDPDDMTDTARRMVTLFEDRAELARLAAGAAAFDTSNWELKRLGQRTTALYYEAFARKPGANVPPVPEVLATEAGE